MGVRCFQEAHQGALPGGSRFESGHALHLQISQLRGYTSILGNQSVKGCPPFAMGCRSIRDSSSEGRASNGVIRVADG